MQVTDGDTTAQFTVIGKSAESIINKKADMVFAESRRIGKMIPPSLENIYGKRFLFIVEINIYQLHKQCLTYDVNKVEAVPAALPQPPQTHPTLSNIHEDHFSTPSESRISTPKRKATHTGLSPQTAHLYIEYAHHDILLQLSLPFLYITRTTLQTSSSHVLLCCLSLYSTIAGPPWTTPHNLSPLDPRERFCPN